MIGVHSPFQGKTGHIFFLKRDVSILQVKMEPTKTWRIGRVDVRSQSLFGGTLLLVSMWEKAGIEPESAESVLRPGFALFAQVGCLKTGRLHTRRPAQRADPWPEGSKIQRLRVLGNK